MSEQSFVKYHGLGNDFIIIDNRENSLPTDSNPDEFAKVILNLCDRHMGIGADGVMFVENDIPLESDQAKVDVRYRIFNSDGYEANICGNGLRCFAKFVFDHKIVQDKKKILVRTNIGILECEELENGLYKTSIGNASASLELVPANEINGNTVQAINESLKIDENVTVNVTLISTGNPHCVIYVDDVDQAEVERIGKYIQSRQDILPQSANVEFVQIINQNTIKIRVYERGCGETLACGTGSCAAVVSGILNQRNSNKVSVLLRGGVLQIEVNPEDLALQVIGPAVKVFQGAILINH